MMNTISHWIAACCLVALMPQSALPQATVATRTTVPAQATPSFGKWTLPNRDKVNDGTVTVLTAPAGGVMAVLGSDLARVLDSENLRVLPVIGKGPVQTVVDLLYLRSMDMGMVSSEVTEFFKLQYDTPDIANRLRYIAKLYNYEIHIVAPTSIKTIYDLAGKKIMAPKDVGFYATRAIFSRLNISADVDYQTDDLLALQKVINGEADAWMVAPGKVMPIARNIKNDDGKLHFVSIPYDPRLKDLYLPSKFTSDEYPNLVPAGETVPTISGSVLLVSYNWPENTDRYNRVARFVDSFFSKIDEFYQPPRSPKWKESSITADIPGWIRFKAAQEWIDRNRGDSKEANEFKEFLAEHGGARRNDLSSDEVVRLYGEFTEWNRTRK